MAVNARALQRATIIGTVLQVLMVVAGHYSTSIASLFAVGGMLFSLIAGHIYAHLARERGLGLAALGGAIAGGLCGLIGIMLSVLLGDVPVSLLIFGTLSSAVTGAIGGLLWAEVKGKAKAEV
jgi:general stress protein CsbA